MSLPDPEMHHATLVDLLRWRAARQPDRHAYTFLLDGEGMASRLTYAELDRQARAIGTLLRRSAPPGARALLLYPPGLDYIAAFFGCLYAGLIAVPAYPPHPARLDRTLPRLQAITRDARPALALTTAPILMMAEALLAQAPDFQGIQWLATDQVTDQQEAQWQAPDIAADSLAFLQYTSGSTAVPKGVMLTHRNLLHNSSLIHTCFGHTPASHGVIWLPPYHDMGLIGGIIQPLYGGFPCTLMSPVDFLQRPLRWLQAISATRATTSGGPNFAYDLCVRKILPEQRATLDLSSWTVAFNGAEPIRPETLARFAEAFGPCGFRSEAYTPCYGLAEATLIVTGRTRVAAPTVRAFEGPALALNRVVPADDPDAPALVGCGGPLLDQAVAIVNPDSLHPCAPDQVGEIWVAGPSVAQGYWNRAEQTAQTFRAVTAGDRRAYLRTGDLGFMRDGELFVTGRLKDLIIIRGRNHYPQDIELTVERCHPALRAGCGAAFAIEAGGEERLVIVQEVERQHRQADIEEVAGAIRRAVAQAHELDVYAVALVKTGSIPKTSSGKLQRHACRAGFLDGSLEEIGRATLVAEAASVPTLRRADMLAAAPEQRPALLETYLRGQIARALGVAPAQVEADQPLVALGLDSLRSVELQHTIESDLGLALPMEQLLVAQGAATLAAQLLAQLEAAPALPIQARADGGPIPLSSDQQRLWLLDRLAPGNAAYNLPAVYRLTGALDLAALERSIHEVVRRHATLRTSFAVVDGLPVQQVAEADAVALLPTVIDLRAHPAPDRERAAQEVITAEIARPFDLAEGPLLRAALLRLDSEAYLLVLTAHHIICDLWSLTLLIQEIAALYGAFVSGGPARVPQITLQYADFVAWQHAAQAEHEGQLAYWQQQLAGAPQLKLLTDRPRPAAPSFRSGYQVFELDGALVESLASLGRSERATLFMTLLAAFNTLLHLCSGQADVVVGAPIAGRGRREFENLIGFCAYPQLLRTDLSGDPTFRELLARVRETALEAYANQHAPFAKVVERMRAAGGDPALRVMFGFLDRAIDSLELPNLRLAPVRIGRAATDLDLFLTMFRSPSGLQGMLEYDAGLFDPGTIAALIDSFRAILEQSVRDRGVRLAEFELTAELAARIAAERQRDQGYTIAISATFTAEPVAESLGFWFQRLGIPATLAFAPYNQVFQQLLDETSTLGRNQHGVNVLLVRFDDWLRDAAETARDAALAARAIERNLHDLALAIQAAAARSSIPYLVCVCPSASATPFERLEAQLATALASVPNVHLVLPAALAALYPVANVHDPHTDRAGHVPFTPHFFTALGTMIARRVYALVSARRKVIVLDCDHTLWAGICGEVGPDGVVISEPYQALQAFMVAQHEAGMLLCLCSRNNAEDVDAVFARRPEMLLKREQIIAARINWRPKSENLAELAAELGLGLDSFIFIDDDPVVCAEVRARRPEVLTLQLPPDPARIPTFLNHVWDFDHLGLTEEDRRRTTLYQQNTQREQVRRESLTLEAFLESLRLEVTIAPPEPDQVGRAAQLTRRTNQFNLTTRRRSEGDLREIYRSERWICLAVSARDRFGDYGMVGLLICEPAADALVVETLLLSCRALGRRIEHRMLAHLGALALARGLDYVDVFYAPTAKNQPALDFLEETGAPFKQPEGEQLRFRFPAAVAASLADETISVRRTGEKGEFEGVAPQDKLLPHFHRS